MWSFSLYCVDMDIKFAFRSLARNPAFTILAVLVLALGIGANTAVFDVVNAVLLKPLRYSDPNRIVTISSVSTLRRVHGQVSAPDFHDWHDQSTAFSALAYYAYGDIESAVTIGSEGEFAHVASVTPEFFQIFGAKPVAGRLFTTEEESAGTAVVISHSFWQRDFDQRPHALGQTIRMFGRTLTIVGVMPVGFHFPGNTDIWFPANSVFRETQSRSAHNYLVVAKLKPNVSLKQAQVEMDAIGARLQQEYPQSNKGMTVVVTRLRDEMVSNFRLTLLLILTAVGVLLLIACANIANLLLARATVRAREIAIRAAVGASRSRILRQLIVENLVLSVVGGTAGLILGIYGRHVLVMLAPSNIPRLDESGTSGAVLVFSIGLTVLTSLLFGAIPALKVSRVDFNETLKQGAVASGTGGAAGGMRAGLVVAEIALSVVLLTAAGLLIRSFIALHNVALGFRPDHVLVMETSYPASGLDGAQQATRFYKNLLVDIRAIPGVSAAGAERILPGRVVSFGGYWVDHLPGPMESNAPAPQAVYSVIAPGTFAALGTPFQAGRDFNGTDTYERPFTAAINTALARKAFLGKDPIGHLIFCGFDSQAPMKIVAVVGDIRQYGPAREPTPEVYMPYEQHPRTATALNILLRTSNSPSALDQSLRRMIHERRPDVPVKFTTLEASYFDSVATPRFRTLLLSILAAIALALAIAGVYGVMTYMVSQRTKEIGIRMALGATSSDVLWLICGHALKLAGIGTLLGLIGAAMLTRLVAGMLFEVKVTDPMTYIGVAILLGVVAVLASYLPASRAIRVDPLTALRQE